MKVIFRVDASNQIGTGHLMRCISLAQNLSKKKVQITFISYCGNRKIKNKILNEGFKLISINNPYPNPNDLLITQKIIRNKKPLDLWVVLDGYHFDSEYQYAIKKDNLKLLVIDDNAHLKYYFADIILNQNIYSKKIDYSDKSNAKLLIGAKYFLLREEFITAKIKRNKIKMLKKNILITMGGSDAKNATEKILKKLNIATFQQFDMAYVVLGSGNIHEKIIKKLIKKLNFKVKIFKNISNMAEIMSNSAVAISSAGSSSWELTFMQVPMILVELAENQKNSINWLSQKGLAINLGRVETIKPKHMSNAISKTMSNDKWLNNFKINSEGLFDQFGPERITSQME